MKSISASNSFSVTKDRKAEKKIDKKIVLQFKEMVMSEEEAEIDMFNENQQLLILSEHIMHDGYILGSTYQQLL